MSFRFLQRHMSPLSNFLSVFFFISFAINSSIHLGLQVLLKFREKEETILSRYFQGNLLSARLDS